MSPRILRGTDLPIPNIKKGLGEKFFETAQKYSDRVFQIDAYTEETETWGQVKQKSVRVAIYLKSIGIKPKDVVMLGFPNNIDSATPAMAALLLGASVVCFNPSQDVSDIKYFLNYIEPNVIVIDKDTVKILEESLNDVDTWPPIIVAGSKNSIRKYAAMEEICEVLPTFEDEVDFKPHPSDVKDTAFIFFSSGTTSLPKGICISHESLLRSATYPTGLPPEMSLIQTAGLYWISAGVYSANLINYGCNRVVGEQIPAERILYLLEKYKIIFNVCTSKYVYDIIDLGEKVISKYDTSQLRILMLIGSTFSSVQIRTLRKLFPHTKVFCEYGCTETGTITSFNNFPNNLLEEKIGSAGKVLPNVELKIVDPETRAILPPNQEGEILVKTSKGMSGYYKSENCITYDAEGFLKTGDLGYYDEEEFIYVTDRLNLTFKYLGSKISPTRIETALKEHPAVQEAVVFGIPHVRDQNHAAACVVLKSGSSASSQELLEFVDNRVPEYLRLRRGLKIVKEFPLTPSGKIQKKKMRELFLNS